LELAAADAWEAHPAEIPVSDRNSIPPTQFLYDGLDIAQQLEAQRTSSYLRSLSIDETLGLTNLDGSFFLTADARGSTGAVTDATGTAVTEYTYDSFGSVSATNPAFANPFQFTGRDNAGLAGLYYYRARYYHPTLQRFISEDPLGFFGGDTNLYAYVLNSPPGYIDPLGLVTRPVPGAVRERFGTPRGQDIHKGVDYISSQGTCVVASDSGRVIKVNDAVAGGRGGNEIVIETGEGDITVYSHTEKLGGIARGARVAEGQPIGRTDYGSGSATGPHLHYQWRERTAKDYTDPMEHLRDAQPYPTGIKCTAPTELSGRKD